MIFYLRVSSDVKYSGMYKIFIGNRVLKIGFVVCCKGDFNCIAENYIDPCHRNVLTVSGKVRKG